ncbi:MPN domain-containing protein [Portibacter lacus]|uniref:JAB1/MPN/MOV34 metalloenzyme domain-containing protein n=1 Tax=Portibacter lacus TaxID=1099794 RepID=A0AA37WE20_9BACT|nr:hypothetical protein [Portibacter lacus]GLR16677.1 hypothetical protein GCM10007940_12920 [Portibacter lacus]
MNIKKSITLLACMLFSQILVYSQDQVRIMDAADESAGRFKTQLYLLEDGRLVKLKGNAPQIIAKGDQAELVLRIKDLRWFEDKEISNAVEIDRSDIELSDTRGMQIASSPTSYVLEPKPDSEADIKFRVLKNGQFSLIIPFTAGKLEGQYVQIFEMEGVSGASSNNAPIGAIADLKKEWKEIDKKDEDAVQSFINKYENNEIAIEERLIAVAERTLMRIQKREVIDEEKEEALWEAIGDSKDPDLLNDFLEQFPDSKYAEAAKAKLGLDADVLITSGNESRRMNNTLTKADDNIFHLDLSHLGEVEIKVSHPDEIEIFKNGGNLFDLKVKGSKKYEINVLEVKTGDKFDFDLDNRFEAKLDRNGKDFILTVQGGVSPYTIEFYKDDEETSLLEARFEGLNPNAVGEISVDNQMLSASGMDGTYTKLTIRDFTTQAVSTFPIDVTVTPKRFSSNLIIGLLLGGLIIGGVVMYLYNKRKKSTQKAYREKAKVFQQTQKFQQIATPEPVAKEPKVVKAAQKMPKKITITKPVKKFVPANGGSNTFVSSGKMKITKREAKGGRLSGEEFREVLKNGKYAFLDLNELWPDSAIKELYLSNECIKALGKFLKEENLDKVVTEMEGAIPEVGGFLMGYHQLNESGHIRVTMDEFVPFVPEYHDVFKIEIGTATLVQELGDAQDTHPDKDVIGWFHTHPGHGLFLSNSDLSVQRHFPLKYQIAMEIDSLTETLDTAFFTRKEDGTINNVEHRKKGANWFSWKKIENI